MEKFRLIAFLLIFGVVSLGHSQFRVIDEQPDYDFIDKNTVVRLTPEMFLGQLDLYDLSSHNEKQIPILDAKPTHFILYFGTGLFRNKFDLDFYGPANFPRNITDYNSAVRRQMFDAEPTSQQRRSSIFRFN
ncbi:MAG: hypothetical protein JJU37_10825 [Balneolaceae bacterium]|nr:hypothetical protein [Balneolaceae bacterium]